MPAVIKLIICKYLSDSKSWSDTGTVVYNSPISHVCVRSNAFIFVIYWNLKQNKCVLINQHLIAFLYSDSHFHFIWKEMLCYQKKKKSENPWLRPLPPHALLLSAPPAIPACPGYSLLPSLSLSDSILWLCLSCSNLINRLTLRWA